MQTPHVHKPILYDAVVSDRFCLELLRRIDTREESKSQTGRIYGVKYESGKVTASGVLIDPHDPAKSFGLRATQASSFGEDADGEMFLCDVNGPVYRIVGAEGGVKATK